MPTIDLDALARARAEKRGDDPLQISWKGKLFDCPAEAPLEFAEALANGEIRRAMTALLNGQSDDFFALAPSVRDLEDLGHSLGAHYLGADLPESPASADSSASGSRTSKRPSKRSTG